jgi:hypothetical protein
VRSGLLTQFYGHGLSHLLVSCMRLRDARIIGDIGHHLNVRPNEDCEAWFGAPRLARLKESVVNHFQSPLLSLSHCIVWQAAWCLLF